MKRGREGRGSGPPAKRGRGPPVAGRFAFKVLCPDRLVAAVLGSSGQTVAKIQEHSGCHCNFSRRNEFFPDTNLRLLVISGPGPAEILTCLELLLDQVIGCADEEAKEMEASGTYGEEDGEFLDTTGDLRLCVALTPFAAGGGHDGAVSRLQEDSGVRLYVDDMIHENHQLAVLAGTREQLLGGLECFNALVQEQVDDEEFVAWADIKFFKPVPDPGAATEGAGNQKVLFVGGLSQQTDPTSLERYFSRFGEVMEADVKMDTHTKRSKGFGFVAFANEALAEACLADPKGHVLDGKRIDVKRYGSTESGAGQPQSERRAEGVPQRGTQPSQAQRAPLDGSNPRGERLGHKGRGAKGESGRIRASGDDRDYFSGAPSQVEASRSAVLADIKWFSGLAESVPAEYLNEEYCISCSLPSARCGALIGRRGENINEVERKTGASVQLAKKNQADYRELTVTGSLISVYAAHLLLMRDYNEATRASEARMEPSAAEQKVQALERELASLKQQIPGRAMTNRSHR